MQRFPKNQRSKSRAVEAARKQLIRREMRFVLHQDVRRFTQQLLARLLDEGCNLNPALVICVYRPTLTLLSNQQIANLGESYVDIRLEDLSPAETGTMVGSLLKTERIPADLEHFLRDKAGGNPFYLEEIINSLVETKTLESAGQIGANATLGRAYRDWGRLYQ